MLHYFMTCTNCTILLCVWHVHRAWLKNVGNKAKGRENKIRIFCALGEIMHSCQNDRSVQHTVVRFLDECSEHKKFLEYFRTTWLTNAKICKFFFKLIVVTIFYDVIILVITSYLMYIFVFQICEQKRIEFFHIPIKTQIMQLNSTMGI